MKIGNKFDRLSQAISENTSYTLNTNGIKLIKAYHTVIAEIERALIPILKDITKDPNNMAKQAAVQVVSSINSSKAGNETFDLMSRLDTLTSGGKMPISGNTFTFNENDKILQYLEKIQ